MLIAALILIVENKKQPKYSSTGWGTNCNNFTPKIKRNNLLMQRNNTYEPQKCYVEWKMLDTKKVFDYYWLLSHWLITSKWNSVSDSWVIVAQSCLTLCNPWTVSCQAPLSMKFSRQDYWSGLPFSSPNEVQEKAKITNGDRTVVTWERRGGTDWERAEGNFLEWQNVLYRVLSGDYMGLYNCPNSLH